VARRVSNFVLSRQESFATRCNLLCLLNVVTHQACDDASRAQSPSPMSSSSFAQKHFTLGAHAINFLAPAHGPHPLPNHGVFRQRKQKFQMSLCRGQRDILYPPFTRFHQRESIVLVATSRRRWQHVDKCAQELHTIWKESLRRAWTGKEPGNDQERERERERSREMRSTVKQWSLTENPQNSFYRIKTYSQESARIYKNLENTVNRHVRWCH